MHLFRSFSNRSFSKAAAASSTVVDLDGFRTKVLDKVSSAMKSSMERFNIELKTLRPGRTDPKAFDLVMIEAYGSKVPLSQVAQIATPTALSYQIAVYDPSMMKQVENVIQKMNDCYTITSEGSQLTVRFPKMSQEVRKEMVKKSKVSLEAARQHIRKARQEGMANTKAAASQWSEDDIHKLQLDLQKLTDKNMEAAKKCFEEKEKDLLTV